MYHYPLTIIPAISSRLCPRANHPPCATGFPISLLLVGMIYTSTKALQFLSVPVYTIFKNLTIIIIAYGEVILVGGSVKPLALVSFGLMVLSSIVAAWADVQYATTAAALSSLNVG